MKIHLIGIGGIGVSALAQFYLEQGHTVSGSDLVMSDITKFLENKGVSIGSGFPIRSGMTLPDFVVYSPAVKPDNPELKFYREQGIRCLSYPEALGELTKQYFTIAVAGAHGKSTTTAMIGLILAKAGLDPTVIVGTKVKEFGNSNFRAGNSKYLVIEACEYEDSFLKYFPKIAVVTNIDKEHLDYFKNFSGVKKSFKKFISSAERAIQSKDYKDAKAAKKIKNLLKVPGQHNVLNALAALAVARKLEIPDKTTFEALSEFYGTWRRFEEREVQISNFKFQIISDYAHHPNEISATLKAAREKYPKKRIVCVFQPHQKQRTYYLLNDFVKVFRTAKIDQIIITDIYDVAGREEQGISAKVSSEILVKKINKKSVIYAPQKELEEIVGAQIQKDDILIIMGAGDIYKLAEMFNLED